MGDSNHSSSTSVTVWLEDDAEISSRRMYQDGRSIRRLSWYGPNGRELVSLYMTVEQAQLLFEMLTTAVVTE